VDNGRVFVASGFARYYQTTLIARAVGVGDGLEAEGNLPTIPEAVAASAGRAFVAAGEAGLIVAELVPGPAPTLTPGPTRPVSPTATVDPNATPTATSPFATETPIPTATLALRTPTPRPTPTAPTTAVTPTVVPSGVIFLPVAHRAP
jgi:hypothetical protein